MARLIAKVFFLRTVDSVARLMAKVLFVLRTVDSVARLIVKVLLNFMTACMAIGQVTQGLFGTKNANLQNV